MLELLVVWHIAVSCERYFEELDSILREYSEKIKPVGRGDAVIKNAESVNQWLTILDSSRTSEVCTVARFQWAWTVGLLGYAVVVHSYRVVRLRCQL